LTTGEPAAYASGVKVNRQKVLAYMLSAASPHWPG